MCNVHPSQELKSQFVICVSQVYARLKDYHNTLVKTVKIAFNYNTLH